MAAALLIGSLFLVMFFHQGVSANPLSRLLTVFAVVEDGRLRADRWGAQTVDKAVIRGHVYSDKAPLTSLLVIPFYWAWRRAHPNAPEPVYENAAAELGDLVASAVPFAIFTLLVFRRAAAATTKAPELETKPPPAWGLAARIALLAACSTCLFNYGNIYYGHMLAALFALGAYVLAVERGRPALAGFVGGLGVLTEYPIALVDLILAVGLVGRRAAAWRRSLAFVAGSALPAVAVLAYNAAVTGKPLDFPYSHVGEAFKTMRIAFGIRGPSFEAAWELVFGQYRGLLFYAPTLAVLGPLALRPPPRADRVARRRWRFLAVVCAVQFLFVCSYFKWDGGWCTGPRHLAPLIALLVYEGAGELARSWPRLRLAFWTTGLFGLFVNVAAAATNPIPAESQAHPLFDVFLPSLYDAKINEHNLMVEIGSRNGTWVFGAWFIGYVAVAVLLTVIAGRRGRDLRRRLSSAVNAEAGNRSPSGS